MHGTTMIFLAVMPLNAAFFNFLVPLQIGARDVAFPRINSFSLWAFVAGALVINFGWILQALEAMGLFSASGPTEGMNDFVPAMGWFGYAPITGIKFTGVGTDFWIMGLQILGIASLTAAMNFTVTIVNMRAPGMKMMRMPVFTWMTLVTSYSSFLHSQPLPVALGELMFDRLFGTNFFVCWRWTTYFMATPILDIWSSRSLYISSTRYGNCIRSASTFAKKPLFGYPIVVFSGAVIGFLGFVWSHHMFTTGLGKVATAAFSLLTMAIAVPTGVKIFNWVVLSGRTCSILTANDICSRFCMDVYDGGIFWYHALFCTC